MVRTLKYMTLLLLLPVCSSAVMAQVGLSIHDTSGVNGTKITIPVYVDTSLTGKNVTSYQLQLSYSSYYMALDSVISNGSMSQSLGSVSYNGSTPGTISIACAGSTSLSGTGILVFIRFKLVSVGYSSISFSGGTTTNFFNEGSPTIISRNGSVTIQAAPTISVYPTNSLLTAGDQQQFTAYSGKIPYHWSLTNPSVASIDSNGLLTATHSGYTRVVARDSIGTIDTTSGTIQVRAFRLSLPDTSYIQGQTFNLPIHTSDLTGLNVTSGSFQIQFNQNILAPTGVVQIGTLLSSYPASVFNNISPGVLSLSFAGSSALSGSGVLLCLQFKVSKTNTGGSTIYPANIVFNENILGDSTSGTFQTINLATLNISPSTANVIDGDTLRFTATGGTPPYTWSTSDSTVALVNNGGLLTALKGGSITVHAVDSYGGTGVSGAIQVYDTRVTIPDTAGVIGDTVDIPIYVSPLTSGMHVQSLQAAVSYDSSIVHAIGIVGTGTGTNGWSFTTNITGNQIVFAGAGATSVPGPGVLCKISFVVPSYVTSGRVSNLNFSQFLFNEGSPRAYTVNGNVTSSPVSLPAAPTSLGAVVVNFGRIDLTWHDNANNETKYTLQKTTDTTASWSTVANLPANTTSDSSAGLTDGTKYYYRVFASNSAGNSGFSNTASAVTPMNPPTNLAANQVGARSIKLTWQDNSGSELGYSIERKLGSSGTYVAIDSVGTNVSTFTDSTGTLGNQYFYRVRGYNSLVTSAYSNEVNLTLAGSPAAPTNLTATATNFSRIDLSWQDNASNETNYNLQRTTDTTSSWTTVAVLPANTISESDSLLNDGTRYFYRVYASNTNGNSGFSNVSSATTPMRPPTNLIAAQIAGEKIKLTWQDNSGSELGYYIERKATSSGTYAVTDSVNANVTTYTDNAGIPGTVYFYRVRGHNLLVTSAYSNEVNLTLTGIKSSHDGIPDKFDLSQNYPNPFNPSTKISYQMPVDGHVTIKVFDVIGKEVATLVDDNLPAGYYDITFNADMLPSGIYFYRLTANGYVSVKKMVLMK